MINIFRKMWSKKQIHKEIHNEIPKESTKLYLHKLNGFTIYQASTVYIISPDPTPVTALNQVQALRKLDMYVQGGGATNPNFSGGRLIIIASTFYTIDVDSNEEITAIKRTITGSFTTDTVTKL